MEYVRILHLALATMEATVASALSLLLEVGDPFDYAEVRDLAEPKVPEVPLLTLSGQPDLKVYDRLLTGSLAAAGVCGRWTPSSCRTASASCATNSSCPPWAPSRWTVSPPPDTAMPCPSS